VENLDWEQRIDGENGTVLRLLEMMKSCKYTRECLAMVTKMYVFSAGASLHVTRMIYFL
jgi:hypothetical protein